MTERRRGRDRRERDRTERRARRERTRSQQRQQNPRQQNPQQNPQNPQQNPTQQLPTAEHQPNQPQQEPTGQQFGQPAGQLSAGQQPAAQQQAAQQPTSQQSRQLTGQQPLTQQPAIGQQPTSYQPQAPFAVGVPTGSQAFAGQSQFGGAGAGAQADPSGTAPAAGGYAGTVQGQLTSQPSGIYPEAFVDHLSEGARDCLDDCIDVSQVTAWCADRCIEQGPEMAQCSRLCNEAATLGSVAAEFIARDSMTVPTVIEAYVETAERTIDELEKFDAPHTNEAEMVLDRSIDSSLDMLDGR